MKKRAEWERWRDSGTLQEHTSAGIALLSIAERFGKWKSRTPGRPRIPAGPERLIVQMATITDMGQDRIATKLLLKIGIQISPCTIRRRPSR